MVTVRLPALLVQLFPEAERVVKLPADDVDALMNALDARWPGMRDRLCDTTPAIRRHINVFVEGKRGEVDDGAEGGGGRVCFDGGEWGGRAPA